MADQPGIVVVGWPEGNPSTGPGLTDLLAAYHLRTEAEKGAAVADVAGLPDRYRAEVTDPRSAFADDVVLLARRDGTAVVCLVLTAPVDGRSEIKRLWTDPAHRGRGVASRLVRAALATVTTRARSGSGRRPGGLTGRTGG